MAEALNRLFGCTTVLLSSSKASDAKESGSSSLKEKASLSSDALPSEMGIGFRCVADMATLIRNEGEGRKEFEYVKSIYNSVNYFSR